MKRSTTSSHRSMKRLEQLRREAAHCTRCELYRKATQTVFGEGPAGAELMLVGESPGDREDLAGHPFVGPAGKLLHDVLREIAPGRSVYLTNAVKHFDFIERGKRRIHQTPKVIYIRACEPWLEGEIDAVQPRLIVALGATAVRALLGPGTGVLENRGKILPSRFGPVLVTIHPAAVLRAPDSDARAQERKSFSGDLRRGIAAFDRSATEELRSMATRKKTARKKATAKKTTAKKTTAKKTTAKKKTTTKKTSTRKYGKKASRKVAQVMEEFKEGKLRSGRTGKKVTNRKQAIAIGISEARAEGDKVPPYPESESE
jgi:uracil-DNA glycosylase